MGFTKTQRICILLGIDAVFFLIELVCGQYWVATTSGADGVATNAVSRLCRTLPRPGG
jgi:hypothetical protein